MIVLINNRDSFVWNLADYAARFDRVKVLPNTSEPAEIRRLEPRGIIISPGPGVPHLKKYVGNSPRIVENMDVPILGVCLGHQIIAHVFGGKVERVPPLHGKSSLIRHDGRGIFKDVKNPLVGGRYHSLAVVKVPPDFEVSAISMQDGLVMGIRHRKMPIIGLQFHPESVLTEWKMGEGLKIIRNFVEMSKNG